jgi:hypothetical protein
MSLILREPAYIRQKKLSSCWFATLEMMLQWHRGTARITDKSVTSLASHWTGRSYDEVPRDWRRQHDVALTDVNFDDLPEVERFLKRYGPFMGGGKVGKMLGQRLFGHAILIYGVLPDGHILHHDPWEGAHRTIKGEKYLQLQDGQRLFVDKNPRVEVSGMGS